MVHPLSFRKTKLTEYFNVCYVTGRANTGCGPQFDDRYVLKVYLIEFLIDFNPMRLDPLIVCIVIFLIGLSRSHLTYVWWLILRRVSGDDDDNQPDDSNEWFVGTASALAVVSWVTGVGLYTYHRRLRSFLHSCRVIYLFIYLLRAGLVKWLKTFSWACFFCFFNLLFAFIQV